MDDLKEYADRLKFEIMAADFLDHRRPRNGL